MVKLNKYKEFEWDRGNLDKSSQKHGISPHEAEEAFLDEKAIVLRDVEHSQEEVRYILIGKTSEKKILFIVFTLRARRIRIISARTANSKEKSEYGKTA